mmetsp:Transcript_13318/g.31360  ORF Transcript_13318/g.31360 Transcript_13318/m.31360 type:complete len:262 (+) Transcript_13318:655-1440(+)
MRPIPGRRRPRRIQRAHRGSGPPATGPACCDRPAGRRWRAGRPGRPRDRSGRPRPSDASPGSARPGGPPPRRRRRRLGRSRRGPRVRRSPPGTPGRCAGRGGARCGSSQTTPGRREPRRLPPRTRRNRHRRRRDPSAPATRTRWRVLVVRRVYPGLSLLLLRDSFRQRSVPVAREDRRHRFRQIPSTRPRRDPVFLCLLPTTTTTATEKPARDLPPTPPVCHRHCPRHRRRRRRLPRRICTGRPCRSKSFHRKSQTRGCAP